MLDPRPLDRLLHQPFPLAPWRAARLEPVADIVFHAGAKKVRVLVHVDHVASQPLRVGLQIQRLAAIQRAGDLGRFQAGHHTQQGRFARAVVASQRVALAGLQHQACDIEHRARAELHLNPLDHEQRLAHFNPPSPCRNASEKFTTSATASSIKPSAMPSANSPLLVSSAIAVGMLRVNPAIMPPTISEHPISETTRPNALNTAAITPKRTSARVVQAVRSRVAPRDSVVSCRRGSAAWTADIVKTTSTGSAIMIWPRTIALRVNSRCSDPKTP